MLKKHLLLRTDLRRRSVRCGSVAVLCVCRERFRGGAGSVAGALAALPLRCGGVLRAGDASPMVTRWTRLEHLHVSELSAWL
jgi:hypothetical protein